MRVALNDRRLRKRQTVPNIATSHYSGAMETNPIDQCRNIIDLLLDAVCVVDPQGRFVFVGAACDARTA